MTGSGQQDCDVARFLFRLLRSQCVVVFLIKLSDKCASVLCTSLMGTGVFNVGNQFGGKVVNDEN